MGGDFEKGTPESSFPGTPKGREKVAGRRFSRVMGRPLIKETRLVKIKRFRKTVTSNTEGQDGRGVVFNGQGRISYKSCGKIMMAEQLGKKGGEH